MLNIGCHLSNAKGYLAMGRTALSIGASTCQFFTRNPRGGAAKAVDPADMAAFAAPGGGARAGALSGPRALYAEPLRRRGEDAALRP